MRCARSWAPARHAGAAIAETFPRKAKKREGKLRRGAAFVALRADGHLLVRTRPANGLLGGMTEVPTTEFLTDFDAAAALDAAPGLGAARRGRATRWRRLPGVVTHVFTHFPLELVVYPRGGARSRRRARRHALDRTPATSPARRFRA